MHFGFDPAEFASDLEKVFSKNHVTKFRCDVCSIDVDGETIINDLCYEQNHANETSTIAFRDSYDGDYYTYEFYKALSW